MSNSTEYCAINGEGDGDTETIRMTHSNRLRPLLLNPPLKFYGFHIPQNSFSVQTIVSSFIIMDSITKIVKKVSEEYIRHGTRKTRIVDAFVVYTVVIGVIEVRHDRSPSQSSFNYLP